MLMLEKKTEENKRIHSYHQCFFLMISTEHEPHTERPQARESNVRPSCCEAAAILIRLLQL